MGDLARKVPLEDLDSSSLLTAFGFDRERGIVGVRFKNGHIYHYAGVPSKVAEEFYTSESKGRYYGKAIKGQYTGQKMTGMCAACNDGPGWIGEPCTDCGTSVYIEAPRQEPA